MSVSLFPRAVVSMHGVTVAPPAGLASAPTLTAPAVDAEVELWSLLSRRPRLGRVTLHRPEIELVVDAGGRQSWDTLPAEQRSVGPKAGGIDLVAPREPRTSQRARRPRPWAIRIVDGTVRYRDERSSVSFDAKSVNIDVTADDLSGPVAATGTFEWEGEKVHLSMTASAGSSAGGQPAQIAIDLAGTAIEAAYEGTLGLKGGLRADGRMTLRRLDYKDLKLGPITLGVSSDGGVTRITLQDTQLHGGRGEGSLTVDATGPAPVLAMRVKLTDVPVQPLLKTAAGAAWLDGRSTVAIDLKGQGRSKDEIAASLRGQVELAVADGAVAGIDIDRSLRALQRGRLGSVAPRSRDRTPFSALTATFTIADGIAGNDDLKLVGEHVELAGAGRIELVPARIDYTMKTKILGAPADDKALFNVGTLEIPVGIKGPLARPEFTIEGQEGVTDALKRIGRNLKSRDVQEAIQGLMGGEGDKRVSPGELIEKLLRND
jgi:AsmA protein